MHRLGLTTLEVLLVLSITGGVLSVATYTYVDYARDSQLMDARAEVQQLHGFVETYHAMRAELPKALANVEDPQAGGSCAQRFDPWGQRYAYYQRAGGRFSVFSRGPDGLPQTGDDVYPPGFAPGQD